MSIAILIILGYCCRVSDIYGLKQMKRLLTDAKVKNLKPKDKAYKTADGGGLYVFTTKAGSKSFRYDFKLHSKYATLTFGTYPEISLAEAREQHEKARTALAKGIDPRTEKVENRLQPFSFYALETVKVMELKSITATKRISRMTKHLFPTLDRKPVQEITAIDLLNIIKPISETGKRETAKLLASYCRQTFDTLLSMQLINNNPAESVARLLPKPKPAENFPHLTDTKAFANLLNAIDGFEGDYSVKQALKLLPLVFLRPHNIRFLKWEYIDFTARLITIPADQMKMNREHKVPLSEQALAILADMKPLTGDREYVFLTNRGLSTGKPMSENTVNVAITRLINPDTGKPFGRGVMTSHGFRHTTSTLLNEFGFNADAVELQLAHASQDRIRATYNKAELLPERTVMMQEWSNYLDSLKRGADVVPINRKAVS